MTASSLVGKRVRVLNSLYEVLVEGECVYVFHANLRPKREDVLKYYFDGYEELMESNRYTKYIMRACRFDRVVIERSDGTHVIPTFNGSFIYEVLEEEEL